MQIVRSKYSRGQQNRLLWRMLKKKYGSSILTEKIMAEKISNILRILLKVFVSVVTFCIFLLAVAYWITRKLYASLPLIIVSAISYYCVIKDHSEDFWKRKFKEPLMINLGLSVVYLSLLLVILFGIVISSRFI